MKKLLLILFAFLGLLSGCSDSEDNPFISPVLEVTLFDKETKAIVYIDYADDDRTIYMWDGTPVAYFQNNEDIYHFNGRFLGWYRDGIFYDKEGYAVAAQGGVVRGEIIMNNPIATSAVKGVKHVKPVRHVQSLKPVTPQFKDEWDVNVSSLTEFFLEEEGK